MNTKIQSSSYRCPSIFFLIFVTFIGVTSGKTHICYTNMTAKKWRRDHRRRDCCSNWQLAFWRSMILYSVWEGGYVHMNSIVRKFWKYSVLDKCYRITNWNLEVINILWILNISFLKKENFCREMRAISSRLKWSSVMTACQCRKRPTLMECSDKCEEFSFGNIRQFGRWMGAPKPSHKITLMLRLWSDSLTRHKERKDDTKFGTLNIQILYVAMFWEINLRF
jgi:hypothetical protein